MVRSIEAIEVGPVEPALVAAIEAAERELGWPSLAALAWLAGATVNGDHVLVYSDGDDAWRSPRPEECSWVFDFSMPSTEALYGRPIDRQTEEGVWLCADRAYARSAGGHWIELKTTEDGEIAVEVDDLPSSEEWGELVDLPAQELRAARITKIMAAIKPPK